MKRLLARLAAWLDAEELERRRWLDAPDEIRDAYLAGYQHGAADARILRP